MKRTLLILGLLTVLFVGCGNTAETETEIMPEEVALSIAMNEARVHEDMIENEVVDFNPDNQTYRVTFNVIDANYEYVIDAENHHMLLIRKERPQFEVE